MSGLLPTDALDLAILTLLIERHPSPVHGDELARAFANEDWPTSIAALLSDGLLHREGSLYLASRPAIRAAELLG
jgi:hypothetical protein